MGSLHEPRYCARGRQCLLYDRQTGKSQKLRKTSESHICERCQRALSEEESAVAAEPKKSERLRAEDIEVELYKVALGVDDLTLLRSRAADELYRLQENLLVEHCLRRGDFWEAITGLRERWDISPTEGIPPEDSGLASPLPKPEETSEEEQKKLLRPWIEDLSSVSQRFFPKRSGVVPHGNRFVTCCTFYDPPRDDLFGFFLASTALRDLQLPEGWETRRDQPLIAGIGLPVKKLPASGREAGALRIYYQGIIQELGERHFKPRGLDVQELVEDILRDKPELSRNLDARLRLTNDEASQYIKVDDFTSGKDVENAFRYITQFRERPLQGGPSGRSSLVAVQYAILQDEYGWTREQIAEKYEDQTDDTFLRRLGDYVKAGRKIVRNG
jgi:hypothetical protein